MYNDIIYIKLLNKILTTGEEIQSRNSVTKRSINLTCKFDSTPLINIRKTAWKQALREMEWFLSGSSNVNDLHKSVQHWWFPWADKIGRIYANYGAQLRSFNGKNRVFDQVEYMIETLKDHPNSRRNVITTWNTADMTSILTPITNCHGTVIQVFVDQVNQVHLTMYQRSADMALGVPHNFIQYWAFLMYLAHKSNRKVGSFTWFGGDCHIYKDHISTVEKMISTCKDLKWEISDIKTPELIYSPTSSDFKADDFTLNIEYKPIINESLKMIV